MFVIFELVFHIYFSSKDDSVIGSSLPGPSSTKVNVFTVHLLISNLVVTGISVYFFYNFPLKILPTPSWRKKYVNNLNLILEQFRNETDVQNVKVALEIMNFIYEYVHVHVTSGVHVLDDELRVHIHIHIQEYQ